MVHCYRLHATVYRVRYSYLNATIGSMIDARRAGHTPNSTPTSAEKANAVTIAGTEITVTKPALLLMTFAPPRMARSCCAAKW